MSKTPDDLRYTKTHEWARQQPDGSIMVGITDHAQDLMGDMVYVELPQVGANVSAGKECAVVESVKAASDVYAPVDGEIVEINSSVPDNPERVNKDPYGDGWLFRIKPAGAAGIDGLMDAKAYEAAVAAEAH